MAGTPNAGCSERRFAERPDGPRQLMNLRGAAVDRTAIKNGLVANYLFGINQPADVSTLNQQIRAINPDVVCSGLGVSDDGITWVNLLSPSSKQNKFVLAFARITLS